MIFFLFFFFRGHNVGKSLCEDDLIPTAKKLMEDCEIPVPADVVCGKEFSETAEAETKASSAVAYAEGLLYDTGSIVYFVFAWEKRGSCGLCKIDIQ